MLEPVWEMYGPLEQHEYLAATDYESPGAMGDQSCDLDSVEA